MKRLLWLFLACCALGSLAHAQERESMTANVWGVLYVNESMSEKVAYDVVKTLFDKQPELVLALPANLRT